MFSERGLLGLVCAALAASVTVALMLADGASWPAGLLAGLGAAGATLLGVVALMMPRDGRPRR